MSPARRVYLFTLFILSLVLLYFFWARGMRFFVVPSESMQPTLVPGDFIVTLRDTEYRRGDVVVLYDPRDKTNGSYLVKRIVGIAGDSIHIESGALYINGSYVSEPYASEPVMYSFPGTDYFGNRGSYTVPEKEVFVLGDNRNHSEDSSSPEWRNWVSVPESAILGRVRAIYLPRSRARLIPRYPLTNAEGG